MKKQKAFSRLTYRNKILKRKLSYEQLLEVLVEEVELRHVLQAKIDSMTAKVVEDLVNKVRADVFRKLKLPLLELVKK